MFMRVVCVFVVCVVCVCVYVYVYNVWCCVCGFDVFGLMCVCGVCGVCGFSVCEVFVGCVCVRVV